MFRKRSDINLKHQLSFLLLFCIYNTVLVFFFLFIWKAASTLNIYFLAPLFRPNNHGTDKLTVVLVLFNE